MLEVALSIAAILAGLVLLEIGADHFTEAIAALARRLRASESTVGLLSAGGEWEELVVVVLAVLGGHPALAVGNVIGSCVANLTGSMPLGLLGRRPLHPDRSARVYGVVLLAVSALAWLMLTGGRVGRIGGGILVLTFFLYAGSILLVINRGWLSPPQELEADDEDKTADRRPLLSAAVMVGSLVIISVGAELVVEGAVHLAHRAGLSEYVIGATVVAIATTLPDKAISLIGGLRGHGGVVFANATGSNIFLLTLVLGLAAVMQPGGLLVSAGVAHIQVPLLLAFTGLVVLLLQRKTLHRWTGAGLLGIYACYLVYVFVQGEPG